jgi:hypothetical protein
MQIPVKSPAKTKLITVVFGFFIGGLSTIPSAAPIATILRELAALLVGGGAVSVVSK